MCVKLIIYLKIIISKFSIKKGTLYVPFLLYFFLKKNYLAVPLIRKIFRGAFTSLDVIVTDLLNAPATDPTL